MKRQFSSVSAAEKRKQTCLKIYKTEFPMQNPQILSKAVSNSIKTKSYTFPSGRRVLIQGYEAFCLDMLLKQGIWEEDIRVGCCDVPSIPYVKENGRNGIYFPDIWIPRINSVIEVKSPWSWLVQLQRNKLKLDAAVRSGVNIYLYVFNPDGSLNSCNFYPTKTD